MFKIFADTHKIIATNINDNVFKIYGFKLDEDSLLWGAISPDILPKYRIIRHYKDESIDYISKEIIKIIFVSRFIEFNQILDPFALKLLSKKIGVISHYLSDYVCLPHAKRWTFKESMIKHIKYESSLNDYAPGHNFKKNVISVDDIDIYDGKIIVYKSKIKSYIEDVVEEYSMTRGFESDLDFALSLNLKITYFIIDTIHAYSEDVYKKIAMEL
ncbi:zinc dependent phospholipase C family protein [Paratissierella segnis]|uniref:Zinc dependent phospholipase C family protein n=1 Tax=Paratissierella segnis TaxID=2763679 RepID=A0A926EYN5_9FIRM|nr:zinc dependent phospholipase C family protein [Paratissierella segnis]MBC8588699.1 zinc dependent phospholipase C family protein [Paratissierella segnis]